MRKIAILLLALFAIAGTSAARSHRKPHKVTRRAGVPRGKRYRVSKSKHTRRISTDGPARLPQRPAAERYKEIQQALVDKGYYKGAVGGEWNAESSAALLRFQADQKLQPDGKIGSLSLIALGLGPKRALTAQSAPPGAPATSLKPAAPPEPETVSLPE